MEQQGNKVGSEMAKAFHPEGDASIDTEGCKEEIIDIRVEDNDHSDTEDGSTGKQTKEQNRDKKDKSSVSKKSRKRKRKRNRKIDQDVHSDGA